MLSPTIVFEGFQFVPWRYPQVAQIDRGIEIAELAAGNLRQIGREALRALAAENSFRGPVLEGLDHDRMYQMMIQASRRRIKR
jgi:hypothetical protein